MNYAYLFEVLYYLFKYRNYIYCILILYAYLFIYFILMANG